MQPQIPWQELEQIFLDMDGVLLDKAFDDWFWEEFVPRRWCDRHGGTEADARALLLATYKKVEETLAWCDLDYWSEQLQLDIPALKREGSSRIAVRPGAIEFLDAVKARGIPLALITNAHPKTLAVKMERVELRPWFHHIICADSIGLAKEQPAFWLQLQQQLPYTPEHTLLVDDTPAVLRSARRSGPTHLVQISRPGSQKPPVTSPEFPAVEHLILLADSLPDTTRHRPEQGILSPKFT